VELSTGDDQRASAFYAGLFGWEYTATADSTVMTGRYLVAQRDGFAVAGIFQTDQPSGWMPHVAVPDTAAAAEKTVAVGGTVVLGPLDLPRYDSIVYARDPLGGPVVLRCPPAGWVFTTGAVGTFASADLNTHDGPATDEFYCRMFGYQIEQLGNAADIDYAEWRLAGLPVLYRYVMGPEYPATTPAHWLIYFVADPAEGTDATAVRALQLGGGVAVEPYDSPLGRAAVLTDLGGAPFAVIDPTDTPESRLAPVELDDE
jgi:predicted enzyme related to lactoylglutathione lyase